MLRRGVPYFAHKLDLCPSVRNDFMYLGNQFNSIYANTKTHTGNDVYWSSDNFRIRTYEDDKQTLHEYDAPELSNISPLLSKYRLYLSSIFTLTDTKFKPHRHTSVLFDQYLPYLICTFREVDVKFIFYEALEHVPDDHITWVNNYSLSNDYKEVACYDCKVGDIWLFNVADFHANFAVDGNTCKITSFVPLVSEHHDINSYIEFLESHT